MSVKTGTATDYGDLLDALDSFLTTTGMALEPSFTGTGNGTIDARGGSAGVVETITVTFTSATAFNVSGSVSGSLGSGTVGVAFTSTKANLTITAGGTAFVATDAFVFDVTPKWTSLRRTASTEMIWQAPGNGGLDEIIVGAKTFFDVGTDYYNWRLGGFQAFDSGQPFNNQNGYVGGAAQAHSSPVLTLWNSSIPYWFIANGRRVIVIAKVSGNYYTAYLGFITPYMSPGSFPYPLVVGGNLCFLTEPGTTDARWRYSNTGTDMQNFPKPKSVGMSFDYESTLQLRLATGLWRGFSGNSAETQYGKVWPYGYTDYASWDWRTDLDGGYSLLPIVLFDPTPNQYGELDGVKEITGFQQGSENTVTFDGQQWLVVQNIFRNTKADFFAVRLS